MLFGFATVHISTTKRACRNGSRHPKIATVQLDELRFAVDVLRPCIELLVRTDDEVDPVRICLRISGQEARVHGILAIEQDVAQIWILAKVEDGLAERADLIGRLMVSEI